MFQGHNGYMWLGATELDSEDRTFSPRKKVPLTVL
jgi:hypothetical protein